MAEEMTIFRLDDLEASRGNRVEGAERHLFSLDGEHHQIDLTPENWKVLVSLVQPYLDVATKADARGRRKVPATGKRTRSTSTRDRDRVRRVRDWAEQNWPVPLSPLGRIPDQVKIAYEKAQTEE